ncbi:MAG: riboflavin biosynthesis protein RibF, partial [Clostridia bacterium]|nr:riboflavin biosynthesis protein RibF [Clostridia bacterium]
YCGFNYHFGNGGTANSENLRDLCSKYNIEVVALPPAMYHDEPVSSTRIRHYLKQGRVSDVTKMLGREYSYELTVCKGNQLGRRMGTPTFNQIIPEELILPRFGVYVTAVTDSEGKKICGVTNIGIKPTIGTESPLAETWLPNYNCGELYGKTVRFELLEFMRGEKKFSSIFELKASILSDGQKAQKIFHNYFSMRNS